MMALLVILQARKNFHWMGDLVGVRIIKMDLTMYLLMEKSLQYRYRQHWDFLAQAYSV